MRRSILIAGPKAGICSPQGILIKDDHLIVLVAGSKSGLKIIDTKQLLNKGRALLQLEVDDVDSQPDQAEASSRRKNKSLTGRLQGDARRIHSSLSVAISPCFIWRICICL